jgi:hypothetical protein
MKITVELPADEVREICELTGISKKGPAIRKLLADSLMLRRRSQISEKFLAGEWSAELGGFESAKQKDRSKYLTLSELWRD